MSTDTVAALHAFYKHKRRALPRVLLITGCLFGITLFIQEISSSTPIYGQPQKLGKSLAPLVTVALSVPVLGGELLYYRQYNKRHERRTIEEFRSHQLRRSVQEQLKPKYFQPVPPAR